MEDAEPLVESGEEPVSCCVFLLLQLGVAQTKRWLCSDVQDNLYRWLCAQHKREQPIAISYAKAVCFEHYGVVSPHIEIPYHVVFCNMVYKGAPPAVACPTHCVQFLTSFFAEVNNDMHVFLPFLPDDAERLLLDRVKSQRLRSMFLSSSLQKIPYHFCRTQDNKLIFSLRAPETYSEYKLQAEQWAKACSMLEIVCSREFACEECMISPITAALFPYYTNELAPPPVKPDHVWTELPTKFSVDLMNDRCVASKGIKSSTAHQVYTAIMWYFGGVSDALHVFYELVRRYAQGKRDKSVVAIQLVLDTVMAEYTWAASCNDDLSGERSVQYSSLKSTPPLLYSFKNKAAVLPSLEVQ
jgi:hypothetical protein